MCGKGTVWRGNILDLCVYQCEPCSLTLDQAVLARPFRVRSEHAEPSRQQPEAGNPSAPG
jgi:hypothetical protein